MIGGEKDVLTKNRQVLEKLWDEESFTPEQPVPPRS
jgi:hypothetical protein